MHVSIHAQQPSKTPLNAQIVSSVPQIQAHPLLLLQEWAHELGFRPSAPVSHISATGFHSDIPCRADNWT